MGQETEGNHDSIHTRTGVSIHMHDIKTKLTSSRIAVVVPAFNEECLISETLNGIPDYVSRVVVVDDASTDLTESRVKSVIDPRVKYLRHARNSGVGAAIATGYRVALDDGADIIAVLAGDNQMDPSQLSKLVVPIIDGEADYTKGNRLTFGGYTNGMSMWRLLGNFILSAMTKVASGYWGVMDPQNGYTAISRSALVKIVPESIYSYYGYCNDILVRLNATGCIVQDVRIPARYGNEESKISYGPYIIRVGSLLAKAYVWRIRTKYLHTTGVNEGETS